MRNYTVELTFGCKMVPSQWNPSNFFELEDWIMAELCILPPISIYLSIFLKKKWNEFNYQDYYLFQTDTV